MYNAKKFDVFVDWEINFFCNFNCSYCFNHHSRKQRDPKYSGHDIRKLINAFNNIPNTWLIHMTGGEPFLQPNFIELCNELTKKHYISINSNFSTTNVYDFADKIDPKKVLRINAALHINQRKDLKEFIHKIKYYEELHFSNIYVTQVMYPPILNNFEKTFLYLKENGIMTRPKAFRGFYRLKIYPQSYTCDEKNLFMKYYKESVNRLNAPIESDINWILPLEKYFLDGELSFEGIRCSAGKDYVYLKYNGDVIRCVRDQYTCLGNIFYNEINFNKEPKICRTKFCLCPHYGLKYAEEKPSKIKLPFYGLDLMLAKKAFFIKDNIKHALS